MHKIDPVNTNLTDINQINARIYDQPNSQLDDSHEAITIKQYRALKRKLQKYEIDNYDKLYLIPCNGKENWYELAEHSALIYYYEVCQKIGSKTKFFADALSFYDQYKMGYVHTLGINHVRENLKAVNLYKSESSEGKIRIFTLNKTFEANYIQGLWQQEKERRIKNLTPVDAHNLDPELHQQLVALSARLHNICNNRLGKLSRSTNGANIILLITELLADYHRLTMLQRFSHKNLAEILIRMRKNVYDLAIYVKILGESRLINLETITGISESIYLIRDRIEGQLKAIAKKGARHGANQNQ